MSVPRRLLVTAAVGMLSGAAFASWPSAGGAIGDDGGGGWIVKPSELGDHLVLYVSGRPPALTAQPAAWLSRLPEAVAGDARVLVMVNRTQDGLRPVRRLEAVPDARRGVTITGPLVLPPLSGDPSLLGLAYDGGAVMVLLGERMPGAPTPGGVVRGMILERDQWREVPLPANFGEAAKDQALALLSGSIGIGTGGDTDVPAFSLLTGDGRAWSGNGMPVRWCDASPVSAWRGTLLNAGAVTLDVTRGETGDVSVSPACADGSIEPARIPGVPRGYAALMVGPCLLVAWESSARGGALECRMLTALGMEVYAGPLESRGPVSRNEASTLLLALGSLFASVILFIARPASSRKPVPIPSSFRYAGAGQRAAATAIDLIPAVIVAEVVTWWLSWIGPELLGPWPGVFGLVCSAVVSAVSEWRWGRSLGKAALGCRVVRAGGDRPGFARAAARNLAKYACPPLGLLVPAVAQSREALPGAFGTAVVVPAMNPAGDP